jgi:signal transduction histidine kinase
LECGGGWTACSCEASKVEAGKMMLDLEPVQVSSLFANSLSIVREKAATRPIHLSMVAPETLGSIQADARKVKQIVYNLLSNAVKFTVEGGQVTLHASRVPNCTAEGWPWRVPLAKERAKGGGLRWQRSWSSRTTPRA